MYCKEAIFCTRRKFMSMDSLNLKSFRSMTTLEKNSGSATGYGWLANSSHNKKKFHFKKDIKTTPTSNSTILPTPPTHPPPKKTLCNAVTAKLYWWKIIYFAQNVPSKSFFLEAYFGWLLFAFSHNI